MDGSVIASSGFLTSQGMMVSPDASWHIVQIGDFNGDAQSDILWRNDSGALPSGCERLADSRLGRARLRQRSGATGHQLAHPVETNRFGVNDSCGPGPLLAEPASGAERRDCSSRRCEEAQPTKQSSSLRNAGLLRFARNDD
jgi:hypothetical protein